MSYKIANKSVIFLLIQRNWYIGRRICDEIKNTRQEDYGKSLVNNLSNSLTQKYGKGFTSRNIYYFIDFYNLFPNILNSVSANSFLSWSHYRILQVENELKEEIGRQKILYQLKK